MTETPSPSSSPQARAASDAPPAPEGTRNQFGMFGGVFTPSILTILGVIMFMRTGFVTGQAGILNAVVILLVAKSITFLTGLSISAISTNTEVKGGGAYFLISRSLGPEFGGAIGLTLFLAQALSVPFYILGFVEALVRSFPDMAPHGTMIGIGTATLLFVINYVGTGWVIKTQYAILTVLLLAILSFMGGAGLEFEVETFRANFGTFYTDPSYNFWTIFAIFFPAVTGIMAGVNMSGDLRDPSRSIPSGTLLAILAGFLVYLGQILLTGGSQTRLELIEAPYTSLLDQALFGLPAFVIAGVFAATISSAIGSFMGAPRILQALARDHIFPALKPFAKGTARGDEPRRGLWLTFFITLGVLGLAGDAQGGGALNAVASVLTMFFLFTYGMTNMAAFVESFTANPSFRPRVKRFHWATGLLGAVGCLGAAILIDPIAAVVALIVVIGLFVYINRRVLETGFGDARRGFYYARVRDQLFKLASFPPHPKNWRPTTLVFTGNPHTRSALARLALGLASQRGLVTLARVLVGDVMARSAERREAIAQLDAYIQDQRLEAFGEVHVAPSLDVGLASLLQGHSIGPLKPNLVVLGWPTDGARARALVDHLRLALELKINPIVLANPDRFPAKPARGAEPSGRRIDVWWRGHRNGSLMVILAHLLSLGWEWREAELRVLRMIPSEAEAEAATRELHDIVSAARIDASVQVVVADAPFAQALANHSKDATLVLLGFAPPDGATDPAAFHAQYSALLEDQPATLLVSSTGDADLMA